MQSSLHRLDASCIIVHTLLMHRASSLHGLDASCIIVHTLLMHRASSLHRPDAQCIIFTKLDASMTTSSSRRFDASPNSFCWQQEFLPRIIDGSTATSARRVDRHGTGKGSDVHTRFWLLEHFTRQFNVLPRTQTRGGTCSRTPSRARPRGDAPYARRCGASGPGIEFR